MWAQQDVPTHFIGTVLKHPKQSLIMSNITEMLAGWSRHQLTACLSSWPPANLNLEPTEWSSSTACAALTTPHTRTFHHFHFQFVFSFSARTLARTVRFGLVRYVAIRFGLVQSTFPSCCGVCWKSSLKASIGSIAQSPNSGIEALFI